MTQLPPASVWVVGVASVKPVNGLMNEPTSDASVRTATTVTPPSDVGAPALSWIGSTTRPVSTDVPGIGCRTLRDSTQRFGSNQVGSAAGRPGAAAGFAIRPGGVVTLTWQESTMRKPAGTAVTRKVYWVPRVRPPS